MATSWMIATPDCEVAVVYRARGKRYAIYAILYSRGNSDRGTRPSPLQSSAVELTFPGEQRYSPAILGPESSDELAGRNSTSV